MRLLDTSLSVPIHFMQQPESSQIGICGIQLVDKSGIISHSCSRFPSAYLLLYTTIGFDRILPESFPALLINDWNYTSNRVVDQVMGAFYMTRRKVFDSLIGFDERFFVYFEDLDFALRARQVGWYSFFLTDAQAMHYGRGSSDQVKPARLFYFSRSRMHYSLKHFGRAEATAIVVATLLVEPVTRLVWAMMRKSIPDIKATLLGTAQLWGIRKRLS
jgi:GT2 family glycosyltransferase